MFVASIIRTTCDFEYCAKIIEWQKNAQNQVIIILEGKNRLEAGDVLEFLSPVVREPILLRVYQFLEYPSNKISTVLHGGQKPKFAILASDFHLQNQQDLPTILPAGTLIRKEKLNSQEEKLKIDSRQLSHQLEAENISEQKYQNKRKQYFQAKELDSSFATKTPRIGTEGC